MSSGEIKLTVMPVGKFEASLSWLVFDPARVVGTRQEPHKAAPWVDVPVHSVLIQHPEGNLLWDTGLPRDWETKWAPTGLTDYWPVVAEEQEWFDSRLKQVGVETGDIDFLVFSHLHWDHAGNGWMFNGTDAKVVCSQAEYEGAFGFEGYCDGPFIRSDYGELPFETVHEDTEILPGVTLLQTPGHTWGTMSLQVDLPDTGTMIFTSDAIFLGDNFGPPVVTPGTVYDSQKWLASVEKIRGIAERTDATVIFGHDAEQAKLMRSAPDYYT
ncbi:N-acyl homoserine lactonase family protein [Streptomyces sp. NPDC013157]|uniref:N-acyl homoserine lactonase family protein n=1 Tax=Streptomyces sp. NPDC013157 TaxID=3364861 RepID=UPI003688303D